VLPGQYPALEWPMFDKTLPSIERVSQTSQLILGWYRANDRAKNWTIIQAIKHGTKIIFECNLFAPIFKSK
jgi:hypothetical protein